MDKLWSITFLFIVPMISAGNVAPNSATGGKANHDLFLRSFLPIPFPRVTTYNLWQKYAAANNRQAVPYKRAQTWTLPQQNQQQLLRQRQLQQQQIQRRQQLMKQQLQKRQQLVQQQLQKRQQQQQLRKIQQQQQLRKIQQQQQQQLLQKRQQQIQQQATYQQQTQPNLSPQASFIQPLGTTTPDGNFKWNQPPPVSQYIQQPSPPQMIFPSPQVPETHSYTPDRQDVPQLSQPIVSAPVQTVQPVAQLQEPVVQQQEPVAQQQEPSTQQQDSVSKMFNPQHNTCEQCNGDCKNYLCYGCGGCTEPPPEKQTYYYPYQRQDAAYHDAFRGNEMALSGLVIWPVPKVPKSWHIFGDKKPVRSKVEKEEKDDDDDADGDDTEDDDDDEDDDAHGNGNHGDAVRKNSNTKTKLKTPSKIKRSLYEWWGYE